ncbi:carbonic anhydrase [Bradyrhizobium centrosematis]|uniref:carbonic anhydrase n=1 Tax=Bradyrhizobium centrosematis TaxID=1300039 RepID=UPI0038908643
MHAGRSPNMCLLSKFAPSRRSLLLFAGSALLRQFGNGIVEVKEVKGQPTQPTPDNLLLPGAALARLLKGNDRYVRGEPRADDFKRERPVLLGGQNPYAAVLTCADSRVAPERVFDSGPGDLFVCRVAGNFAGDGTLDMEYAVSVLNTPLIVVLGHDHCGTIDDTIRSLHQDKPTHGQISCLVNSLAPAVTASLGNEVDAFAEATRRNVIDNVNKLKSSGPILNAAVAQNRLKVVGALYRIETGKVDIVN